MCLIWYFLTFRYQNHVLSENVNSISYPLYVFCLLMLCTIDFFIFRVIPPLLSFVMVVMVLFGTHISLIWALPSPHSTAVLTLIALAVSLLIP